MPKTVTEPTDSVDPMDDIRTSLRHHQTRLEDALQKVKDALTAVGDSLLPVFPDAQPAKRKGMSAASRAAASKRMKAYWQKRRKAGGK